MGGLVEGLMPHSRDDAMSDAANQYEDKANQALDMYKKMYESQQEYLNPYWKFGTNALNQLSNFGQNFKADPGYQFRLDQGLQAMDRSAAARGGLQSGAALKGAQQYGQNLASNEYNNAFNRQMSMAGMGQQAANSMGNYAGQYGQNYGNALLDMASNRGNSMIAGQNAKNQGWSDIFGLGGRMLGGLF